MIQQIRNLNAESHTWAGDNTGTLLTAALRTTRSTLASAAGKTPAARKSAATLGFCERIGCLNLGLFGVPGDQATATALLYGLAAVAQGVLAAPLFLTKA